MYVNELYHQHCMQFHPPLGFENSVTMESHQMICYKLQSSIGTPAILVKTVI